MKGEDDWNTPMLINDNARGSLGMWDSQDNSFFWQFAKQGICDVAWGDSSLEPFFD